MSKEAIHVCIVTPSFAGGGAEKIAVGLANHYALLGHRVTLVSFINEGPYRDQVSPVVNVIILGVTRTRYAFTKLLFTLKGIKPDTLLSVIRDSSIFVGLTRFFYSDYRCIYREANTMDGMEQLGVFNRILTKCLMKIAYKKADAIIANSDGTRNSLLTHGVVDENRCVVIVNPVLPSDYKALSNEPLDHPWLVSKNYKTILSVGRLHKQKNHAMLVRGFAEANKNVSNLRLIIIGEGEEKTALFDLAVDLKVADRIDIIGFQKNPFPFYKNADVFVLTSSWEGFGNVLVEALACGTPVISTDCPGGPRGIMENGKYGRLVEVDNADQLVEAILDRFDSDQENTFYLSDEIEKKYGIEPVAKKYMSVLSP